MIEEEVPQGDRKNAPVACAEMNMMPTEIKRSVSFNAIIDSDVTAQMLKDVSLITGKPFHCKSALKLFVEIRSKGQAKMSLLSDLPVARTWPH